MDNEGNHSMDPNQKVNIRLTIYSIQRNIFVKKNATAQLAGSYEKYRSTDDAGFIFQYAINFKRYKHVIEINEI